ncbi:MAG: lipid-A-disaccharide synthase [Pararhizobium sp.]
MTEGPVPPKLRKLAIIAGESSGDVLGAGLIAALRERNGPFEIVGVGGEAMEAQGLSSLFDYHELSIVGASAIVARLPLLLYRIRQTADAVVRAKPDVLVIIDSPGFTHRVARRLRKRLPYVPIVNYVCPTVWAWKPKRAPRMVRYVDHVLSVLPFEPKILKQLGGPPVTYVGHSMADDPGLLAARAAQDEKRVGRAVEDGGPRTCLVLPGSRSSELKRLLPPLARAVAELKARRPATRFVLPAVTRHEARIREAVAGWPVQPEVVVGPRAKWRAFAEADAAIAASGTVLLELALAGVPCVSVYKLDALARLLTWRIKTWTAALPNMVADYPVIPEYINESVRPGRLVRWMERLTSDTLERRAMIEGFDIVKSAMATTREPAEHAAAVVLEVVEKKAGRA